MLYSHTGVLHHSEFKIRDIFEAFFGETPAIRRANDGIRYFADPAVKASWLDFYHRASAYELTCATCNSYAESGLNHHSRDEERPTAA